MDQGTLQTQGADAGVTEQAKQKVSDAAGQAQETVAEKTHEMQHKARNQFGQQVDQRSTDAGQRVRQTAGDVRSVADQLRAQGKDQPAKLAERAADQAERLGGYLERSDGDRILRDVEDFGRRQPMAILAGGLALGFAASRFLKASSEDRYRTSSRPTPMPAQPPRTLSGNGHSTNPVGSTGSPTAGGSFGPTDPAGSGGSAVPPVPGMPQTGHGPAV